MRTEAGRRLIEVGFPCHEVGAETERERGASSALPPLYFLQVWWARRPLTPSRAAVLASLVEAGTDPVWFLRQLGIEQVQALVNGTPWILTGPLLDRVVSDTQGKEHLPTDRTVLRALEREQKARGAQRELIDRLVLGNPGLRDSEALRVWRQKAHPIPAPFPNEGTTLAVRRVAGDPSWFKRVMQEAKQVGLRVPNLYGYERAYKHDPERKGAPVTVLDPTAGGGSIPFEALRLGHRVIANELNPVAGVILCATLDYPLRFGRSLTDDIERWGMKLYSEAESSLGHLYPTGGAIPRAERDALLELLGSHRDLLPAFDRERTTTYLYARQVTCTHCGGEAPLLNSCWLSQAGDCRWGVRIIPDGKERNGRVSFEPYRVVNDRGPDDEDPNAATVFDGEGTCPHCRQAILASEIKAQARGESDHGTWTDRLYVVVCVRREPKLDRDGVPQRYKSGRRKGQLKTRKIRFFRPPSEEDLKAIVSSERLLQQKWAGWEARGLIPTETIPPRSNYNRGHRLYGVYRWCDMFTPRQLLVHVTLVGLLDSLAAGIMAEHGHQRGRAILTYLQFAINKGVAYNGKQSRWDFTGRGLRNAFERHNYSLKWTFGEMAFEWPSSGRVWALSQIIDAYTGIACLLEPLRNDLKGTGVPVTVQCETAAHMASVPSGSVELVCMDPPYYGNVQYAELSDFFYVWMRRTLRDHYPSMFGRRLTNKEDEAVANRARDGSLDAADVAYERLMREIFAECRRVLMDDGVMTLMFSHKKQEAWEALTRSLIESGWVITASLPVVSESEHSTHQKGVAAASSSIFLSCRKRVSAPAEPAVWRGFGGSGIQQLVRGAVRAALEEFRAFDLSATDEMVACYGRALRVLSENWPVMDGDEPVTPMRAMTEASSVVAEAQVARLTESRLAVTDLAPEAAMALTIYGIHGLAEFRYDDALNLSRSLGIRLEGRSAGYVPDGRMAGVNPEGGRGRGRRAAAGRSVPYHAPLVRKGDKLRLLRPEERSPKRMAAPATEWDALQGLILAYRKGDIPVARAYLAEHAAGREQLVTDMLSVWTAEMTDEELRREGEAILFGLR